MSAFLACAVLTVALQGKKAAPAPPYVGDWVTIQQNADDGKEALHLAKDGTFSLKLSMPNQADQLAKGHYAVKADELPPGTKDKKDCTIYLTPEQVDGKAVAKNGAPPKKLGFYSRGPILTDTVAVVFCHPGDQDRILKLFSGK